MKLATIRQGSAELAAIIESSSYILIDTINAAMNMQWSSSMLELIRLGQLDAIKEWYRNGGRELLAGMASVPLAEAQYAPLYRHPRKIWGIGMNYVKNASELAFIPADAEPVSFMKPDTTIIGSGEAIQLPRQSQEPTAEAELAIIIGRECRNVTEAEARDAVAGFTTSLDMTAADIHAKNQRFLTRAKSFDTFFSFGPHFITADEIEDVLALSVETVLNGAVCHRNVIAHMRYQPWYIVAFHSQVMTLLPGDVILTGTPGSVIIRDGDVVECRISGGFEPLVNSVRGC
ncbi:hypothetical protein PAECIP111893_03485 [Paenibacillus plantiphilus]|uniref:Fumarylacetoacetase-like C-terminal domain-containing protein n=1 Tax=Paenibacillus plantiphilus TaxID=2905650 RepID=A0ABM9CEW6_9BACL|nr:fumarylacetoacetate hydrolase family protein [Paenibacillus plantiphilus]CAH1212127.1 hypothetical protein PAECIP111893_03485 [Paenibacillus plantiphilus]